VFKGKKVGRAKLDIKVYLVPKVRLEPPVLLTVRPVKPEPESRVPPVPPAAGESQFIAV
jgi:hypothetical protein